MLGALIRMKFHHYVRVYILTLWVVLRTVYTIQQCCAAAHVNDEYGHKNIESLNGINSQIFDTQMHSSGSMCVCVCDDGSFLKVFLFICRSFLSISFASLKWFFAIVLIKYFLKKCSGTWSESNRLCCLRISNFGSYIVSNAINQLTDHKSFSTSMQPNEKSWLLSLIDNVLSSFCVSLHSFEKFSLQRVVRSEAD